MSLHLWNTLIDVIILSVEFIVGVQFIITKFEPIDWNEVIHSYKGFIQEYAIP